MHRLVPNHFILHLHHEANLFILDKSQHFPLQRDAKTTSASARTNTRQSVGESRSRQLRGKNHVREWGVCDLMLPINTSYKRSSDIVWAGRREADNQHPLDMASIIYDFTDQVQPHRDMQ